MKELFKMALVLAAFFASTFILIKVFGLLSIDDIKSWLTLASQVNYIFVSLVVISLLFLDLFIAVPTLTITLLAGYFLGFTVGALSVFVGFMLAGLSGYAISRYYGVGLLEKIYKDKSKLDEMQSIFTKHGATVLIMCRAMPILPEVSCCLSGANKMPFFRFLFFFLVGTVPYLLIATYVGSQSTLENPKPAIFGAISISLVMWFAWFVFYKKLKKGAINES